MKNKSVINKFNILVGIICCLNLSLMAINYFPLSLNLLDENNILNIKISHTYVLNSTIPWSMGTGYDYGEDIEIDTFGNIYITGATNGIGNYDVFIAKYNSLGILQWNNTWGGTDSDKGYGIALDVLGNIYVTGVSDIFTPGQSKAFVIKYNNSGIHQWNTTWDYTGYSCGNDIVLDNLGNIYIAGSYSNISYDAFIVKFDDEGNEIMNATWKTVYNDEGNSLTLDNSGNIYISGETYNGTTNNYVDFIAKYSSSGYQEWNNTFDFGSSNWGKDVAVDNFGNIYYLVNSYIDELPDQNLYFLIKYNSFGFQEWNVSQGGLIYYQGKGLILDGFGNIFITGSRNEFAGDEAFVTKFDDNGNFLNNLTYIGGTGADGKSIALDSLGNIYITGNTFSPSGYDTITVKFNIVPIPPTWDQIPSDQVLKYGNPFHYDVNASEPDGIIVYMVNDSYNFQINSEGIITNRVLLSIGDYWLNISVINIYGLINTAIIKITITNGSILEGGGIPGYNILLFICTICIFSFILYRKKRLKKKKNQIQLLGD